MHLTVTAPRRVLRYVVGIDDQVHVIADGPVLMTQPRRGAPSPATTLEVWVEAEVLSEGHERLHEPGAANTLIPAATRTVQVYGTGQLLPDEATWLGSCTDGPLVWHLNQVQDR